MKVGKEEGCSPARRRPKSGVGTLAQRLDFGCRGVTSQSRVRTIQRREQRRSEGEGERQKNKRRDKIHLASETAPLPPLALVWASSLAQLEQKLGEITVLTLRRRENRKRATFRTGIQPSQSQHPRRFTDDISYASPLILPPLPSQTFPSTSLSPLAPPAPPPRHRTSHPPVRPSRQ